MKQGTPMVAKILLPLWLFQNQQEPDWILFSLIFGHVPVFLLSNVPEVFLHTTETLKILKKIMSINRLSINYFPKLTLCHGQEIPRYAQDDGLREWFFLSIESWECRHNRYCFAVCLFIFKLNIGTDNARQFLIAIQNRAKDLLNVALCQSLLKSRALVVEQHCAMDRRSFAMLRMTG